MNLQPVEALIQWLGGLLAYSILGILLFGIWKGTRRQAGRTTGRTAAWLRSPWFYLVTSAIFFGVCYAGWLPLPLTLSSSLRLAILALGSILLLPGLAFVLWGRLALGKNYFVSTGFGAQLFAGHQLITTGPFALVRHPMYSGLIFAAFGSLLVYLTWTTLLFACFAPFVMIRARREETALAQEFGQQWLEYCRRVPPFLPRLKR